ncbi:MAG: methyltransferase domain-containing protein [Cognatishimia sp.]
MKDMTQSPDQSLSQSKVQQSFRRGLNTYHEKATHQADIAAGLADRIQAHAPKQLKRVLEFGMGTGHLTRQMQQSFAISQLYLNDLVSECESFAPKAGTFIPGPIEKIDLPTDCDVICSANTVQWIRDLPTTTLKLKSALHPGGLLALSGFGSAQFHELRTLGSSAAAPSYVDAEEWRRILPEGMTIKHLSQGRRVEWFPSAMAILKHLRETGVNGSATQTWTTGDLKAFEHDYRQRFGTQRGLPLTYDPVWMIAQKS